MKKQARDAQFEELQRLAYAHLRGEASGADIDRLEYLVAGNQEACRLYLEIVAEESMLRMLGQPMEELGEDLPLADAKGFVSIPERSPTRSRMLLGLPISPASFFVAALALIVVSWVALSGKFDSTLFVKRETTSESAAVSVVVAQLVSTVDARWRDSSDARIPDRN